MLFISVGVGTGDDAYKAGLEACDEAIATLNGHQPKLCFVFASVAFDQEKLLEAIVKNVQGAIVIGCSSAGEISSEGLAMDRSVVLMAIATDSIEFFAASGDHTLIDPKSAGIQIAEKIQYDSRGYVSAGLLFLDVIAGHGEDVFRGATTHFGTDFPLFGGSAGDDLLFFQTYQYLNNKAFTSSAVGLGMAGKFTIGYGVAHGFLPVGISRKVTRAEGANLYELDGKPAISIYSDYFGPEHMTDLREGLLSSIAVSYPLGVTTPDSPSTIIRNPVYVDNHGVMTFTSAIPEGADVRLMISGRDEAIESAKEASRDALKQLNGKTPKGALIINSVARRKLLGSYADEEIRAIQQILGRDVPIAGYYTYAQLGGAMAGLELPFHNSAIIVMLIAE